MKDSCETQHLAIVAHKLVEVLLGCLGQQPQHILEGVFLGSYH